MTKRSIKVKRAIVLITVVLLGRIMLRAQFDPMLGQYAVLPTAYNPAAAGEGDLMKVAGLHRMQYIGIKNAPMTTYFSFTSPFVIGKTKHGAGVRFMNDRFGLFTNQSLHAQYCYRQPLGKGHLSAGVDLGFINVGFKGDSVNLSDMKTSYFDQNDPLIPTSLKSDMKFDLGVGVYYATPVWWVGASYSHVTIPRAELDMENGKQVVVPVVGTMYVSGGYRAKLPHHKEWALTPSAMVMSDFRSWDVNMTLMCEYMNKYRWGLGYRILGSVNLLVNIDIINGLVIGYTCELPTSRLLTESFGTHEIYLAYSFEILKPKRTNKYKSVRYL